VTGMAAKEHEAEVALEVRAELGEGPVWDERSGELYFVDILGERVHSFRPASGEHRSFEVGRPVGSLALREDGGLVLAAHDRFFLAEADGAGLEPFGELEVDGKAVRFNDGKACPGGWFVAGTMDWAQREPLGCLYMLRGDGSVSLLLEKVTISNGLAWSEDGSTLYFIDSPRRSVDAFNFDCETGAISNRRTVAEFPDSLPDGMAIDLDGLLWVACFGGGRVERIDPSSGRTTEVVRVPTSQVTSIAFGGPAMAELFITTAWVGMSDKERAADPHAGDLFVAHSGVSGPPPHRFRLQNRPH
jgi:sugar lactone lactonase YvrE